jgi:hypothetical protein
MREHVCPSYFSGTDIIFQVAFLLVCMYIGYRSFEIYALSKQRETRLFGVGFTFLGISYGLFAIMNTFIGLCSPQVYYFLSLGHILTGLGALITLAYAFSHVKNWSMYLLLLALMIVSVVFSLEMFMHFYFVGLIFFGYIALQCFLSYWRFRKTHTLRSALAFFLLFLAQAFGMLALNIDWSYVFSHVVSLAGYLVLLVNVLAVKHEKKAR